MAGYSDDAAAIRGVRTAFGQVPQVEREELRRLWRDRLETVWRQALADVHDRRSGAVTHAVRVSTAAAALDGLKEAQRSTVDIAIFARLEQELITHEL